MSRIIDELRAAGADDADIRRLCDRWGGLPLYIPRRCRADHPIIAIAGERLAAILSRLYGGESIYVPLGVEFRRRDRDAAILDMARAGRSTREIARDRRLHVRQVQRILARHRARPEA